MKKLFLASQEAFFLNVSRFTCLKHRSSIDLLATITLSDRSKKDGIIRGIEILQVDEYQH